jgi:hypothetical protein
MSLDLAASSSARDLDAVDVAAALIRRVRDRAAELAVRCGPVVAAADWRAPSAGAFHDRVDALHRELGRLETMADDILDLLARTRVEIALRAAP